jgi:tRNA-splicing ligase RtcB
MYQLIDGIPVWGHAEEGALRQIKVCAANPSVYKAMLMADNHPGYGVPIGGVVAYRDAISPTGVGFDIGCGNRASRLNLRADAILPRMNEIMDEVSSTLSFGIGRKNNETVDHELFHDDPAWSIRIVHSLKQNAQNQLGTIGSGNHYINIFSDETGDVWVGVHFGSRGFGHKIATHYIEAGGGKDGIDVEPVVLPVNSYLGEEYIAAMKLAGRYAYAGRDWVVGKVASILSAEIVETVHNHHNFAWKETAPDGDEVWVVRKGATPSQPGQKGFIGGTMGDISVIIEGVDGRESRDSLYSTVHGAGRVMSRTRAAGRKRFDKRTKQFVRIGEGEISRDAMMKRLERFNTVLRGADVDEAPQCYKDIEAVLDAHEHTIKILHTLHPMGVAMAGNEFDPWKD